MVQHGEPDHGQWLCGRNDLEAPWRLRAIESTAAEALGPSGHAL